MGSIDQPFKGFRVFKIFRQWLGSFGADIDCSPGMMFTVSRRSTELVNDRVGHPGSPLLLYYFRLPCDTSKSGHNPELNAIFSGSTFHPRPCLPGFGMNLIFSTLIRDQNQLRCFSYYRK